MPRGACEFSSESRDADVEILYDLGQPGFRLLVDPYVVACDSKKPAGKTVQCFRALAVLTFEEIPQQCRERLDRDEIGEAANRLDRVAGEDQRRRRLEELMPAGANCGRPQRRGKVRTKTGRSR